jgi:hypothetical protein
MIVNKAKEMWDKYLLLKYPEIARLDLLYPEADRFLAITIFFIRPSHVLTSMLSAS